MGCPSEHAETLAEEILILQVLGRQVISTLERFPKRALKRNQYAQTQQTLQNPRAQPDPNAQNLQFGETLHVVGEKDTYQSQVENASYTARYENHAQTIDCSSIHLTPQHSASNTLGFGVDVGAPRSVVGQ